MMAKMNWKNRLTAYFTLPDISKISDPDYRKRWYQRLRFPGRCVKSQLQTKYEKYINNALGYDNRANYTDSASRRRRYRQYALMEYTPELSTALDIYADQITVQNQSGQMFEIKCSDPKAQEQLYRLFYDVMGADLNLWQWARMAVRNGDHFLGLIIDQKLGIIDHKALDAQDITIIEQQSDVFEGHYKKKYRLESRKIDLEEYQVAHFRILNQARYLPYGKGILEAARRVWRQLTLAEDRMLIYRMVRAPQRRVFNIQVGNIEPKDVQNYMNQVKSKLKSQFVVDPQVGDVVLSYKPTSVQEDYFIPKRGDRKSQITTLAGGHNATAIEDIQYLQQKLFATIKVPKAYLNYTGDLTARATAAVQDVRFAKTVQRMQKSIRSTMQHIAWVHLLTRYDMPTENVTLSIKFFPSSTVLQSNRLDLTTKKFQTYKQAVDGKGVSKMWARKHILNLSIEEQKLIEKQQINEAKFDALIAAIGGQGRPEGGGGFGSLGGGTQSGGENRGGDQMGMGLPGGTQQTLPPVPRGEAGTMPTTQTGPVPGGGEGGQK